MRTALEQAIKNLYDKIAYDTPIGFEAKKEFGPLFDAIWREVESLNKPILDEDKLRLQITELLNDEWLTTLKKSINAKSVAIKLISFLRPHLQPTTPANTKSNVDVDGRG